ncbi:hypothetical protein MKI77_004149 [Escherichia coli]|nr:hypothetical protein [Escherichia coli]
MLKTFRVFARAVNGRGYTIGITQNVSAVNVKQAIEKVKRESQSAGLEEVRISTVYQVRSAT